MPNGVTIITSVRNALAGSPAAFPQGLWNVEFFPVEKLGGKISPHLPVDDCGNSNRGLWKKSCCGSKAKDTFPHKFLLMLLILPKPMKDKYIYLSLQTKG